MTGTIHRKNQGKWIRGCILGLMIVVFLLLGCAAARPSGTEFYKGKAVAPNEVLVKFRGTAGPQVIDQAATGENVDETEFVGSNQAVRFHSRSKTVETLIRELSAGSDVEYVEPNYIVQAVRAPNDPYFQQNQLWGLMTIGAPAAWDFTYGSTVPVVAVVDTGIDYTHPDLAANIWTAPNAFTVTINGLPITCPAGSHGFNAITNKCDPMDDNNHGTHVSGTIGAVGDNNLGVVGLNWQASIMGAKFLDASGSGYVSNAVNAIDFVIQAKDYFKIHGGGADVRVLSNSWGGTGFSQTLLDEINKANADDMLFVAAAGNSGTDNGVTYFYPADYGHLSYNAPNVLAVAATDSTDSLASWSNYGKTTVDLAAPGVNVLSTIRGGSYATYSGTSMATPHVSGAAALILSKCALSTDKLKSNILSNVDPITSLTNKIVTGGRLDVYKAIQTCSGGGAAASDFGLSAYPSSLSLVKGAIGTSTITVSDLNGFSGPVTLSPSVNPATASGPVVSLSQVTPSGPYTLTVDATSAAPGNYLVTVTGTDASGTLTHVRTVAVTVTAPDFSISASPASVTVNRGGSAKYTVTITPLSGFTGTVNLMVSSLPTGATGTFNPTSITISGTASGKSTLTVTTATSTPSGTYQLTITGTNSGAPHSTKVTLVVRNRGGFFGFSSRATGTEDEPGTARS